MVRRVLYTFRNAVSAMSSEDGNPPRDEKNSEAPTLDMPASGGMPDAIGPYQVVRKLGEGGMGEVWLARQTAPIRRQVAIKIIKAGMDTRHIIARFEMERQALALMDHPCIAKVFEAGETPRGLPYFAMEYVEGEKITSYCDRRRLELEDRLRLLRQVCDGVQHAHHKGVIHRDLKPSNVLVSVHDQQPLPKIIDFGVAKATEARLADASMHTELGVIVGTPGYMSPEQLESTGEGVDTRSDVYALGVILYELMTGALPFDAGDIRKLGPEVIRFRTRDMEVLRPSARVKSRPLARRLRGDLDWITLRALEKDRNRRYASPGELAADLGRHLQHEPVLAGPPGAAYRIGKFARRHRFGVATTALAAASLVGFALSMAAEARRTKREWNRAELVSSFLESLFAAPNPRTPRTEGVTAREILDRGAAKIDQELAHEPEARARLLAVMGSAYQGLGQYKQAEELHERSLKIHRAAPGKEDPDTLAAMSGLADDFFFEGRYAEAETLYKQVLGSRRRRLGNEHPETLASQMHLALAVSYQGRFAEAEPMYRDLLAVQRRVLGDEHPDTVAALNNLGNVVSREGHYAEAERLLREVLAVQRRVLGNEHPDTLTALMNLSSMIGGQQRHAEAETLAREALDIQRRVLGNEHPETLSTKMNLAVEIFYQGRFAEAEGMYREVLAIQHRVLGDEHPNTLTTKMNLSGALASRHRYDEAERLELEVLKAQSKVLGERHPDTVHTLYNLGCLKAARGDRAGALQYLRRATDRGLRDADFMAKDPDLEPLHGDREFEALVAAARENATRQ
jgi:serine/threonine protein kinase/Tfp pilus assembly protein PilF